MMIPPSWVFIVWALAAIATGLMSAYSFRHKFRVVPWIMMSLFGGSLAIATLYYNLSYSGLIEDIALTRLWVRAALIICGFSIMGAAIITYTSVRRTNGK